MQNNTYEASTDASFNRISLISDAFACILDEEGGGGGGIRGATWPNEVDDDDDEELHDDDEELMADDGFVPSVTVICTEEVDASPSKTSILTPPDWSNSLAYKNYKIYQYFYYS